MQPFSYLARWAEQNPDAVALSSVDNDFTYEELFENAVRFAHVLRDRGIMPGDVVAVQTPAWLYAILNQALFHEAAVGAVMPAGFTSQHHDVVDWVLTGEPIKGFPTSKQILINQHFLNLAARASADPDPISYPSEDSNLQLVFSSGTTGVQKAVPITVSRMAVRAFELREQWMLGAPFMCLLGMSSMLTFVVYLSQIAHGETFVIPGNDEEVLDQVERWNINAIVGSPHQLGNLVRTASDSGRSAPTLKTIGSIGAVLPDSVSREITEQFRVNLVSLYGSSEGGIIARREGLNSNAGHAGRLLDDVEYRVIDENGNELPESSIGLIGVKRANQPQEYFNDPEGTRQAFRDGFFYAGDMGYFKGRDLYLVGRKDELINAAGSKVDPARVESFAMEFTGIKDAAAFGLTTNQDLDVVALAFVSGKKIEIEELVAFMKARLGDSAPSRYVRVKKIPRTKDTFKVDRDELVAKFSAKTE